MAGVKESEIVLLESGVTLAVIPVSPNDDYRAGSDGKVYSRTKYKGFGRKDYVDWYPLKGRSGPKGYVSVSLSHNNVKVTKNVHRLICMAFHGMPASQSMQVRHLDGDPNNNKPENLKWGTQIENWQDRKAHGNGMEGEKHHSAVFSDKEREHIRWCIAKGLCSQTHASRVLSVASSTIYAIVHSPH